MTTAIEHKTCRLTNLISVFFFMTLLGIMTATTFCSQAVFEKSCERLIYNTYLEHQILYKGNLTKNLDHETTIYRDNFTNDTAWTRRW